VKGLKEGGGEVCHCEENEIRKITKLQSARGRTVEKTQRGEKEGWLVTN